MFDAYVARRIAESPVMLGAGEARNDAEGLGRRAREGWLTSAFLREPALNEPH